MNGLNAPARPSIRDVDGPPRVEPSEGLAALAAALLRPEEKEVRA